jgi:iron complex outermembrane recepter protein
VPGLDLTLGATELDAKLTQDFCLDVDASGLPLPLASCPASDAAPSGTTLPIVPRFKGSATARYSWPLAGDVTAHVQGDLSYQSTTRAELVPFDDSLVGDQSAYGVLDVLAGVARGNFTLEVFANNVLDKRADTYRFAECTVQLAGNPVCGLKPLAIINTPRTIGIRFGQRF